MHVLLLCIEDTQTQKPRLKKILFRLKTIHIRTHTQPHTNKKAGEIDGEHARTHTGNPMIPKIESTSNQQRANNQTEAKESKLVNKHARKTETYVVSV